MTRARGARRAVVAGVLTLALTGAVAACAPAAEEPGEVGSGYVSRGGSVQRWGAGERTGPLEMSGTTYDGSVVDLAELRGSVVVLNTWYAACPPCRAEAPDLVEIATAYADRGVHVVGINTRDDAGAAEAFERTFATPYPSIDDRSGAAVAALQGVVAVQAVPTTVVLDAEGRVAARVLGRVEASTLRVLLDDALAGQAA